jgi:hypothetical protein
MVPYFDRVKTGRFQGARKNRQQQTEIKSLAEKERPTMKEHQQPLINDIQHLHFELFRRINYNLLDGERVVRDLLEWRDLWYSVLPVRFPSFFPDSETMEYQPHTEIGMLRTTRWNSWPADTLYIWTNEESLPPLQQRIEERWMASEMDVIMPDAREMRFANVGDKQDRVLCVWWD